MMISCKKAARLVSAAVDHELTPFEKISLRFHLIMCRFCRRYAKQIDLLHQVSRSIGESPPDKAAAGLSSEAKERIKKNVS
jgi:predicted anti-sigma-YlaC factor YlaD